LHHFLMDGTFPDVSRDYFLKIWGLLDHDGDYFGSYI
jgi:hypothetical protein